MVFCEKNYFEHLCINRVQNQSLDIGVQYDTKCVKLGKLAAEIWVIL